MLQMRVVAPAHHHQHSQFELIIYAIEVMLLITVTG